MSNLFAEPEDPPLSVKPLICGRLWPSTVETSNNSDPTLPLQQLTALLFTTDIGGFRTHAAATMTP